MSGVKLSVIIPVYNLENYIENCVYSLEKQDFLPEEYEIICVNDGSIDQSEERIRKLQEQYTNIRLINQKNSGVSAARNTGIQNAQGEYIWFVDGDDLVRPDCLGKLYRTAADNQLDKLLFRYCFIHNQQEYREKIQEALAPAPELLMGENGWTFAGDKRLPEWNIACNYWIRREVLLKYHLSFPVHVTFGEDKEFAYWMDHCTGKAGCLQQEIYFYLIREDSAMHTFMSDQKFESYIKGRISLAQHEHFLFQNAVRGHMPETRTAVSVRELEDRRITEVQGILNRLIQKGNRDLFETCLKLLKESGLYPYPVRWHRIFGENLRQSVINMAALFLPLEGYLRLLFRIGNNSIRKKLRIIPWKN